MLLSYVENTINKQKLVVKVIVKALSGSKENGFKIEEIPISTTLLAKNSKDLQALVIKVNFLY